MKTSDNGKNLIKFSEGVKTSEYRCAAGFPTIGVGHKILPGEQFYSPISSELVAELLDKDLATAERVVTLQVAKRHLNQGRFDALVSFVFNLGASNFTRSTLLKKLNTGDYQGTADEFLRWDKATINGILSSVRGLTLRRRREQALFLGQSWTEVI